MTQAEQSIMGAFLQMASRQADPPPMPASAIEPLSAEHRSAIAKIKVALNARLKEAQGSATIDIPSQIVAREVERIYKAEGWFVRLTRVTGSTDTYRLYVLHETLTLPDRLRAANPAEPSADVVDASFNEAGDLVSQSYR